MRFVAAAILITLSAGVFAQKQAPADSVYWFEQGQRKVTSAQQNAAGLLLSDYEKISIVSIAYQLQNGHLRTSQTAENDRAVAFNSSGINTLGRFKMAGYFNFQRNWQDSLAWTLQGLPNDATPYYFAAKKAGKYQRINYNFGGLLSYNLVKNKLYLAAGTDYLFNTASRSVDPRPTIQTFQLNIKPQVLYQTGKHAMGAIFNWGYGKESNNVGYNNTQYSLQSPAYADRINYLIMGYGLSSIAGSANLRRQVSNTGLGVNYAYKSKKAYANAIINYVHNAEDNFRSLDNSANRNSYGKFAYNDYSGSLLAGFNTRQFQHQLQADVSWQSGSDKNYREFAGLRNYLFEKQFAALSYLASGQTTKPTHIDFGLSLFYEHINRQDIASNISSTFAYLQPGLSGNIYHMFKDRSKLSVFLKPAIRLPVGNQVKVPVSDNIFANNVIYPDYAYWSSTLAIADVKAQYITAHLFKGVNSGITVHANYYSTLRNGTNYTTTFTPSGQRINLSLGFNLYF